MIRCRIVFDAYAAGAATVPKAEHQGTLHRFLLAVLSETGVELGVVTTARRPGSTKMSYTFTPLAGGNPAAAEALRRAVLNSAAELSLRVAEFTAE